MELKPTVLSVDPKYKGIIWTRNELQRRSMFSVVSISVPGHSCLDFIMAVDQILLQKQNVFLFSILFPSPKATFPLDRVLYLHYLGGRWQDIFQICLDFCGVLGNLAKRLIYIRLQEAHKLSNFRTHEIS